MLKRQSLALMILIAPLLWAQAPTTNDKDQLEVASDEEKKKLQGFDPYLDTLAELESWVLAESALVDLSNTMNVEDMVTPIEDFMKSMLDNLSGTFASYGEHELGITLELTPENQVLVTSIEPEGRFHHTDLKADDVIIEINEQVAVEELEDPVATMQYYLFPYANVITGFPPLSLTVDRKGKNVEIEISNDDVSIQTVRRNIERLHKQPVKWLQDSTGTFTFQYSLPPSVYLLEIEEEMGQYFGVEFGVLVLQAPEDSDFEAGDILVEVEDTAIRAIDHVTKSLKRSENDEISTVVKRKGKSVELKMERSSIIFRNAEEQMIH